MSALSAIKTTIACFVYLFINFWSRPQSEIASLAYTPDTSARFACVAVAFEITTLFLLHSITHTHTHTNRISLFPPACLLSLFLACSFSLFHPPPSRSASIIQILSALFQTAGASLSLQEKKREGEKKHRKKKSSLRDKADRATHTHTHTHIHRPKSRMKVFFFWFKKKKRGSCGWTFQDPIFFLFFTPFFFSFVLIFLSHSIPLHRSDFLIFPLP